jgi:hypothetical protein
MNLPHLIGLYSPAPGCGKTTLAEILVNEYGYIRMPLATPLKAMTSTLLQQLDIPRERASRLINVDKSDPIPEISDRTTARHLLQTLGTEWGRSCVAPDIWLRCWEAQYRRVIAFGEPSDIPTLAANAPIPRVVVDDCRFPNEADLLRNYSGEIWHLTRRGIDAASTHASEGGLSTYPYFNHHIANDDDTIDALRDELFTRLTSTAVTA